jgi:hypothetical protein
MKLYKITIGKERTENKTRFVYPKGYDAKKFDVLFYQNEGLDTEYCIAKGRGVEKGGEGIEEISKKEAKDLISKGIEKDKDLKEALKQKKSDVTGKPITLNDAKKRAIKRLED